MIRGKVHKFGDNIDTDAIIPITAVGLTDPGELGRHCMGNIDPGFADRVEPGDIIVGGANFGCGSSREIAPWSIKGAGISLVIAVGFARIFFRNAINIGLPVMQSPQAAEAIGSGEDLEVDPGRGLIRNLTTGETFTAAPYPKFVQELISGGGLVEYIRRQMAASG